MDGPAARILVGLAVVAVAATDALYLAIVAGQGGEPTPDVLTVPFVAGYLALMGVLLLLSLNAQPEVTPGLRAAASAGLLGLGFLSGFMIGLAVLVAAGLAVASTVLALIRRSSPRILGSSAIAAFLAVAVLVAGFQFAWQYLVCPPTGQMSGTTAGFFGQASYQCDGGRLTLR